MRTVLASHDTGEEQLLDAQLALVFAPLHKLAFGLAIGTAAAVAVAALTAIVLFTERAHDFPLGLLSQYFRGYDVSVRGIAVGAAWAGFTGFVAGWFMAFCRNLALAASAFFIRARAELSETRDFLDHI